MSFINKFGESSTKKNNLKPRTCDHNYQINRIAKELEHTNNALKDLKEKSQVLFSNYTEKRIISIEELILKEIKDHNTELSVVKHDINTLKQSIANDINNDMKTIQKAVTEQISFLNKDFFKNIQERLNKIEEIIFTSLDKKNVIDIVKKRKIEYPKIKIAK